MVCSCSAEVIQDFSIAHYHHLLWYAYHDGFISQERGKIAHKRSEHESASHRAFLLDRVGIECLLQQVSVQQIQGSKICIKVLITGPVVHQVLTKISQFST